MSSDLPQRLRGALVRIRGDHPFFGTLALFAQWHMDAGIPTAATDGRRLIFNPEFIEQQSLGRLCGLVTHELLHMALQHCPRRCERDAELWNIAADVVVNGMIRRETAYDLPEGGVEIPELAHLSVEEVYEQLLACKTTNPKIGLLDLIGVPGMGGSMQLDELQSQTRHWRGALQQAVAVTARIQRGFGRNSLGENREFDTATSPSLGWRELLWQFMVATPYDFSGFDRRFINRGLYLEDMSGETVAVAIAIDTSGSIDASDLNDFMVEVAGILAAYPQIRGELYFADAKLYGPYPFAADQPLPEAKGGGGTSFRPFFEHLEKAAGQTTPLAIYFTDGYGEFPARPPDFPVLWVVAPGGLESCRFQFGEVARMGVKG